jgi:putative membrane protein
MVTVTDGIRMPTNWMDTYTKRWATRRAHISQLSWLRHIAALGGPDGERTGTRAKPARVDSSPMLTPAPSATRDLLANERTLLAWARTAVAIMGLGFVVARFGYVIRVLAGVGTAARGVSTAFGIVLVLCGMLLLALANVRYLRLAEDILHNRVRWDPRLGVVLTSLLVLAGPLLAVYLLLTS